MPVSIADLFISVSADVSAAQSGLTQLGNQLDKTDAQFRAAAPAALVLSAAGAAVATGFGAAVGVAASFEQAMANVRAVMSPNEATQFGGALGDLAVQLGQQTVFSAREAAAGIGELIKAGIAAPDVLNGAGAAALNLAAATGISVANAATIAAQTMNAFHKSASELTGVVDTLAGVANATAADMSDLQFGLQVVSATAQTMGLSFEDTATAIGVFVSAGETGSTAGTGLRQMLLELLPTTKPAKEEMQKLGLSVHSAGDAFFDSAGHVKSLAQISQVLQNALRGMSDEQRIAALNTLFTRDAINSATILANQGAAGINAYSDAIGGISAADTAATRLGTLQGALNNLGSSFETVQIIVGNLFVPVLTTIANATRGIVDQFSNLGPEMQRAIVFFGGLGGAIAGALGAIVLLSPIIVAVIPAFAALSAVLIGLVPVFVVLAGVAAVLVAAWQSDLGGIQGIVSDAFAGLPDAMDRITTLFSNAGELWQASIVPGVSAIATALATRLEPSVSRIASTWSNRMVPAFQAIGTRLGPIVERVISALGSVMSDVLLPAAERLGGFIVDTLIPGFVDLVANGLEGAVVVGDQLATLWSTRLAPALQIVGEFVATQVAPRLQALADNAMPSILTASEALQTFWDTRLGPAAESIGNFIAQNIGPAFSALGTAVQTVTSAGAGVLAFFAPFAEQLGAVAANVGPGLVDFFGTQLPSAFQAFAAQAASLGPFIESIGNFLGALFNVMTALATVGGTALLGLFQNVLVPGFQQLGAVISPIQPAIESVGKSLETTATNLGLIGDRLQPVTDFFNSLAAAVSGAGDAIRGFQLPAFLTPGTGSVFGATQSGPQIKPASFSLGGGDNGSGPLIQIGTLNIGSEAEKDQFLEDMAAVLLASSRRVTAPPDNSGVPSLSSGVI